MKKNIFYIIACLLITSSAAFSEAVQWTRAQGGNGHFYDLIQVQTTGFVDFFSASLEAQDTDVVDPVTMDPVLGRVATIESQGEQDFIMTHVLSAFDPEMRLNYDYAWIGLTRASFATGQTQGDYYWTTDPDNPSQRADYFNWAGGQPRAGEDFAMMILSGGDRGKWASSNFFPASADTVTVLVEYNTNFTPSVIPVPPTFYSMALGLGGLLLMARKRKRAKKV